VIFENTEFDGLKIVNFFRAPDDRGVFVKPWLNDELIENFGSLSEAYFSSSEKYVLRGLHFQYGTKAQKKYVVCLSGSIEDIAIDMRRESSTFGKVFRKKLNGMDGVGVIIPSGFAHGIYAHEQSTIVNFCDKPYSPGDEGGIKWNTVKELSDLDVRIISEKDRGLCSFKELIV
jgi:dTDP-4-dehydrorhamnose 3,5-epimerase